MKSGSPLFRSSLAAGGRPHHHGGGGGGGGFCVSRPLFVLFCAVTLVWLYCFTASSWWASPRQNSDQIRGQILELSEKYVKTLASESGDLVDGPYTGRLTGYDLKKTLAVLLQNLMDRMARLEKRVFASGPGSGNNSNASLSAVGSGAELLLRSPRVTGGVASGRRQSAPPPAIAASSSVVVDAEMLLSGYQESCDIPLESKYEYPECEAKVEWMLKHWRDDPCYAQHGVDGTECSMKIFLSEVEEFCPVLAFRQRLQRENSSLAWVTRQQLLGDPEGRLRAKRSLLDQLSGAPGLRERVSERWPAIAEAASVSSTVAWPERWPRQRLLVHVAGAGARRPDAAPLVEAAQYADLLSAAAILGHQITVAVDKAGLRAALERLNYAKTECQGKRDAVVTHLVTDLVGIMQVRSILGKSFPRFACLYRVLAPHGVEPKFNDRAYASANDLSTSVSGLDLNPSQYLSLFPFTLENTFIGAALPPPPQPQPQPPPPQPQQGKLTVTMEAFIFGFGDTIWKESAYYLSLLKPHFARMHTAVDPRLHPSVPQFVINHGQLNCTAYKRLLTSIRGGLFVGLGSPYEHLAPVEAASLGLPFLNLRFSPPLDRSNSPYLREVPVSRKFHSQDAYLEAIGEPASYLVDLEAKQAIPDTLARAAAALAAGSLFSSSSSSRLLPLRRDFSPGAYLARVRAVFSAPSLCREPPLDDAIGYAVNQTVVEGVAAVSGSASASSSSAADASAAAVASVVQFYLGVEGRSCTETCASEGRRGLCAPDQMRVINRRLELQERGIRCRRVRYDNSLAFPALSGPGQCHFLSNARLFSCDERLAGYNRLCPCRMPVS